jgi:chromate transporter
MVLMLGLYRVLVLYQSNPYVAGLIRGVQPIIIVLLLTLVIGLVPTAFPRDRWLIPTLFFAGGFVTLYWLKVPPVWVIVASMAGGVWLLR